MDFSNSNRRLLRGMLAGAVALAGASACSRSAKTTTSGDTTQTGAAVTPSDSVNTAVAQPRTNTTATPANDTVGAADQTATVTPKAKPSHPATPAKDSMQGEQGVSGYHAMGRDTSAATASNDTAAAVNDTSMKRAQVNATDTSGTEMAGAAKTDTTNSGSVKVGDSTAVGKPGERINPSQAKEQANADTLGGQNDSTHIRPPEDSTEVLGRVTTDGAAEEAADTVSGPGVAADTTASGYQPMARDTSAGLAQLDTATQAQPDTSAQGGADTATVHAQMDTAKGEASSQVAVENRQDTVTAIGDSAEVGKPGQRIEATEASPSANADTLASENGRIRPPEDSTEVLGNVTTQRNDDVEAVGDAGADQSAAGAAAVPSTGNMTTGAEAVASMSREGEACGVVKAEDSHDAQWDMASSPTTINPCGTGTMTLPRIQTGEK
jgi:hypothetical protein